MDLYMTFIAHPGPQTQPPGKNFWPMMSGSMHRLPKWRVTEVATGTEVVRVPRIGYTRE